MAVNTDISLASATEKRRKITVLADLARTDLEDAISSLLVAVDSDRKEFLVDCAKEFLGLITAKLKLASTIALSMTECGNGEEKEPQGGSS